MYFNQAQYNHVTSYYQKIKFKTPGFDILLRNVEIFTFLFDNHFGHGIGGIP